MSDWCADALEFVLAEEEERVGRLIFSQRAGGSESGPTQAGQQHSKIYTAPDNTQHRRSTTEKVQYV
jgi:hypothetical protein